MYTTIDDLVDGYKNFLSDKYPVYIKKHFCDRLASYPAGAEAEAVVFYFFRSNVDDILIEEASVEGGADFRCKIQKSEFVVEVTNLDTEAVTKASGLKNEIPETGSAGSFSWINSPITNYCIGQSIANVWILLSEDTGNDE